MNMIISKINSNIDIVYKEKNFPEISHQYLDSKNIKKDVGWQSKVNINDGLDMTIEKMKRGILK